MTDKPKYSEKARVRAIYIISALFIAILGLFMAGVLMDIFTSGASPVMLIAVIAPFIAIVALLIIFIKRRTGIIKSGLIVKDEMTIRAEGNAGRYTSIITIWFLLALMWYQGFGSETFGLPELAARHVIYLVMFLTMGLFFGLRWHFTRRGDA